MNIIARIGNTAGNTIQDAWAELRTDARSRWGFALVGYIIVLLAITALA